MYLKIYNKNRVIWLRVLRDSFESRKPLVQHLDQIPAVGYQIIRLADGLFQAKFLQQDMG